MYSDPLSDCFTRIKNASKAKKEFVEIPYSALKEKVVQVLQSEGFVSTISQSNESGKRRNLVVYLKYEKNDVPVLESIRRISKPGHRIYSPMPGKTRVREGLGFQILSTSKGIMTDRQAIDKKVGGEVLAEVY